MNQSADTNADYLLPPLMETEAGEPRHVGIELEFIGIDLREAVSLLQESLGGSVKTISDYEFIVTAEDTGKWNIERDQDLLKRMGRERNDADTEDSFLRQMAEAALNMGSELIVPLEVVSPPLRIEEIHKFQDATDALARAGARGTDDLFVYAFGLQLNPELPSLDADTIVAYMQAYFCLQDWLIKRANIDYARQLTNFAEPFSRSYIRPVIDSEYKPDMDTLISDYLEFNPTRNRSLDLLPLFAHINEQKVRSVVPDKRVKARPTFHYRLPNSLIGNEGWTIYEAWNDWVMVERLAHDDAGRAELCERYSEELGKAVSLIYSDWPEQVDTWISKNLS